ncbi:unnamed protein product [Orchesella dallaii]|uniref:Uncharacterized protein n=1 Tax=Orchesella dallaii TaxID=48710 RepID=A0ABP1QC80_9HEXA
MPPTGLKKAKKPVTMILKKLLWVHKAKWIVTAMFVMMCWVYAFRNVGDNGGDGSTPQNPEAKHTPLFCIIPNWDTLTADGNTWLAIETGIISSFIMVMSLVQGLSTDSLLMATKKNVEAKEGVGLVRTHIWVQLVHILGELMMLVLTLNVPVFHNLFVVLIFDVSFITLCHLMASTSILRLLFEYDDLVGKDIPAEKKETDESV